MMFDFQTTVVGAIVSPEWPYPSTPKEPYDVVPTTVIGGSNPTISIIIGSIISDGD